MTNETIDLTAKYRDGLDYVMERPSMPLAVEEYDQTISDYREAYEAGERGQYQVSAYHLTDAIEKNELELFAHELEARIKAFQDALEIVNRLKVSGQKLFEARKNWERDVWRFHDYERALETFDLEADTVRAVAEEMVKDEALEKYYKGVSKRPRSMYWIRAERIALRRGMERTEIDQCAREYIEANPMRYAPSTGRLTYLKKGGN
jgi:hypothetical protein